MNKKHNPIDLIADIETPEYIRRSAVEVLTRRFFLAQYMIREGEHEHDTATIYIAPSLDAALTLAHAQEYDPSTDNETFYFSYGGDCTTACRFRSCEEITEDEVQFLARVGLVYTCEF